MKFLKEHGIDSGVHYIPVHHFSYFKSFVDRPLPATDRLYNEILTLPLYPEMSGEEAEFVIQTIKKWAG
jgi:dTDP-4-amino-4,6-dideoxygalactose transaminase